jgi:sec-independent protein translocase protein TatC
MRLLRWPYVKAVEMARRTHPEVAFNERFLDFGPSHTFLTYLKVALLAGAVIAAPAMLYQMWRFVAAGLYRHERRFILTYAPVSFLLFALGMAFGYAVLLRYGLYFLMTYGDPSLTEHSYHIGSYVNLVLLLTFVSGVIFQLPVLMAFFSRIGLVDPAVYRRWRRHAIVLIFVVAAFLTPPDVFTQILMAIPLLVLYEAGILAARAAWKRHAAATATASRP